MIKRVLATLFLLFLCCSASAAFFVSPNGTGSHDGSEGNEFSLNESIAFADQHLNEKITFLLSNGSYSLNHANNSQYDIPSRTAWITFKPKPGHNPVFTKISVDNYGNEVQQLKSLK